MYINLINAVQIFTNDVIIITSIFLNLQISIGSQNQYCIANAQSRAYMYILYLIFRHGLLPHTSGGSVTLWFIYICGKFVITRKFDVNISNVERLI